MKLTDICDFQGGSQPPKEEWSFDEQDGYVRMLQIRDFTQSERVAPEYVKISNSTKICETDDILIARYGASIGKILTGLAGAYNVAIMRTIPDTSKIKKKYLYYYLKSSYFQNAILNVGSRAAQAGFNKEDLSKLDIECPELADQDSIVSILEKVEAVIEKRKEELSTLDNLIKARFVEMFGSIKEEQLLGDISEFVTVGIANSATHAYAESGIPMLRNQNIKENFLDDTDMIYIKPEFAAQYESKKIKENDIIAMRTGYPGVACLVPKKYEGCQTFTTLIVRLKKDNNPSYVCSYINSDFGKRFIDSEKVGVAQQNVGAKSLAKMPIKIAPKQLQDEYADFVKQVDKSKVVFQKSLIEYGNFIMLICHTLG